VARGFFSLLAVGEKKDVTTLTGDIRAVKIESMVAE